MWICYFTLIPRFVSHVILLFFDYFSSIMLIKVKVCIIEVYSCYVNFVIILIIGITGCNSDIPSLFQSLIFLIFNTLFEKRLIFFSFNIILNVENSRINSYFNINFLAFETLKSTLVIFGFYFIYHLF